METRSQSAGALTVLFADVAGSTRLYEALGNDRAFAEVGGCLARLAGITQELRGTVIKTVGDEIMCTFATADSAVLASTRMQQSSVERPNEAALQIRVGLQHGEVITREGDVFGDTVNVAARLTSLAKPGQILTTVETAALLPAFMRAGVRQLESVAVKGKTAEVAVSEIIWQQDCALTMMEGTPARGTNAAARLVLFPPDGQVELGGDMQSLSFGRDAGCGIVVQHPKVSRNHARIERRRDKFVLVDSSTNGTWVRFDSEPSLRLRLEETILRRSGQISFGEPPDAPTAQPIRFEIQ